MAKKAANDTQDRLRELEAQQQAAEEAFSAHRERLEALQDELEKAKSALRMKDLELDKKVEELLDSLPPTGSSEKLVTELQKFKQAGRSELNERVIAFEAAIKLESGHFRKAEAQIPTITRQIEQEHFDQVAREIHSELADFNERFKALNGLRLRLFELVKSCGFKDAPERFKRLGLRFPMSFGILVSEHIATRSPDTLAVDPVVWTA
jgi:phage-related tail protein